MGSNWSENEIAYVLVSDQNNPGVPAVFFYVMAASVWVSFVRPKEATRLALWAI